jgi:hypothetical protein
MVRMLGVGQGVEHVVEARYAAAVFGRVQVKGRAIRRSYPEKASLHRRERRAGRFDNGCRDEGSKSRGECWNLFPAASAPSLS